MSIAALRSLLASLLVVVSASAAEPTAPAQAHGEFDVQMESLATEPRPGATLGRSALRKTFRGDLAADGRGEMLTAIADTRGSASYVAVEHVTGTLGGRRGSFTLVHRGTMQGGAQQLSIEVVPDSGTDELVGLAGTMSIEIRNGRHHYRFAYRLPPAPPVPPSPEPASRS